MMRVNPSLLLFVGILELVFPRTGTALQVPALARDLLESPLQLPLEWPWIPENILEDDYEAMSFPQSSVGDGIVHWSLSATVPSTHRNYTIHTGSLSSGLPKDFSFQIPEGGCCHRAKVSSTASSKHCVYATNAGFFDSHDGCCVGNLIINSSIEMLRSTNRVNFGLNHSNYVVGYLTNKTITGMQFLHMISGAGWLVRKGVPYIKTSMTREDLLSKFVMEKAPRTAIVIHKNGTLSLMQVDGEEDISAGLDLFEFSEVLLQFGAWHAVNLDGGGSSVSVFRDQVISKPTCIDIHFICERLVSSIACMKEPESKN